MNDNINKVAPAAHLMLDLETLGTKPGSVILEIGAVIFWPDEPSMEPHRRKWRICPQSCVEKGLTVDVGTLLWWLAQPAEAQLAVLVNQGQPRVPLWHALRELEEWAAAHGVSHVWGKGPTFDLAHLARAHEAVGTSAWWHFAGERCVRTIYDLAPEGYEFTKPRVAHDSLCDAMAQAVNVVAILAFVKRAGEKVKAVSAPAAAPASDPSLISHPSSLIPSRHV